MFPRPWLQRLLLRRRRLRTARKSPPCHHSSYSSMQGIARRSGENQLSGINEAACFPSLGRLLPSFLLTHFSIRRNEAA